MRTVRGRTEETEPEAADVSGDFVFLACGDELNRPPEHLLEEIAATPRRPDFQLGIPRHVYRDNDGLADFDLDIPHHRKLASIQSVGNTEQGRQHVDDPLVPLR